MDTTSTAMKNVDVATAELKGITGKINRGEGTVGALINDKTVYDQMSAATADARETIAQAKIGATAFQENMQALKGNFFLRGFFKRRGYKDSSDLTKFEIAKLPASQPSKRFSFDATNIFAKPDTAKLKNQKALQQVGQFLETNPHGLVVVRASAGLSGDKEENLVLTQARAMVVREYLAENFKLDDSRIKTKGLGETPGGQSGQLEILVYPATSDTRAASATKK
jgi:outer membrane protein OmpA-like peptidoglycan-associated protein